MPTYPDCSYVSVDDTSEPTGASYIYCLAAEVRELKRAMGGVDDLNSTFTVLEPHCDRHWDKVALYLPLTSADQVTDFKGHTFLKQNSSISSSGGIFNEGSLNFGGVSSYLYSSSDGTSLSDIRTNSNDFTWEMFVYHNRSGGDATGLLYETSSTNKDMYFTIENSTGVVTFNFYGGAQIITSGTLPNTQWCHVKVTRNGTLFSAYIDNVLQGTDTYSGSITSGVTVAVHIGDNDFGTQSTLMRVGYLRLTIGVVRDDGVPIEPFDKVGCSFYGVVG